MKTKTPNEKLMKMRTKMTILPLAAALFAMDGAGNLWAEDTSVPMETNSSASVENGQKPAAVEARSKGKTEPGDSGERKADVTKKSKPNPSRNKTVDEGEKSAQEAYFRRLDGDENGRVTYEEYEERRPGRKVSTEVLRSQFGKLDSNRNGYCTPAEFVRARLAR